MIKSRNIKTDCKFFKGYMPCIWNKTKGYECDECPQYQPINKRVLVIKLDAIGDVLRSTCIIPKIKEKFPNSHLTWITRAVSGELFKYNPQVDDVWIYGDAQSISRLYIQQWDIIYNLDNTYASSALASIAKAKQKVGFVLTDEGITATNNAALNWLSMAVFDRLKRENTHSYQEIMYKICGFSSPIEKPYLAVPEKSRIYAEDLIKRALPEKTNESVIVGINTGSGSRWPKKMLNSEQIIRLIRTLLTRRSDCYILLLGGPNEVIKNKKIVTSTLSNRVVDTGCNHLLLQFAAIISRCDAILCGDTLALHIASALDVPTIAVFGPTSSAEIYDYDGLIEKVGTKQLDCLCCYSNCNKAQNCMSLISHDFLVEKLVEKIDAKCEISRA
jgi:ADP-heptose:LPS heptosyltransferase